MDVLKDGDVVRLTGDGWDQVTENYPEIYSGAVLTLRDVSSLNRETYWGNFVEDPDDTEPWIMNTGSYSSYRVEKVRIVGYPEFDLPFRDCFRDCDRDSEVNPNHYKRSIEGLGVEVIEILEFFFEEDPLLFNAGKYLLRAGHKGDLVTDLEKLKWYVQRRIDKEQEN